MTTRKDLNTALETIKQYARENCINPNAFKDAQPSDHLLISAGLAEALNHDPELSIGITALLAQDVNAHDLAKYIWDFSDKWFE